MKRQILKKPQFEEDLVEIFAYIAADSEKQARKFLQAAGRTLENLAAMPGMGREWESDVPRLAGIRVCVMPSPYRNYLIFYRFNESTLEALTLLHGARDVQTVLDMLTLGD